MWIYERKAQLIIFLSNSGVIVSAFNADRLVDSQSFEERDIQDFDSGYYNFLRKYCNSDIVLLIDSDRCAIVSSTDSLPGIVVKDRYSEYIKDHITEHDLIACKFYDILGNDDKCHSTVCSVEYKGIVKNAVESVIHNFKSIDVYLLPLEFENIINNAIRLNSRADYSNYLQIFILITEYGTIRIVIKYKQNILKSVFYRYDTTKSDLYIQGTFEQLINEQLSIYGQHKVTQWSKRGLILVCREREKKIFENIRLSNTEIIFISGENFSKTENFYKEISADNMMLILFNRCKKYKSLNKSLKSFVRLNFINFIIFKPILVFVFIVFLHTIYTGYSILRTKRSINKLNKEKYYILDKCQDLQNKYPTINNILHIADLYNKTSSLPKKSSNPLEYLTYIFTVLHNSNIAIDKVTWDLENPLDFVEKQFKLNIYVTYRGPKGENEFSAILGDYENNIKNFFGSCKVKLSYNKKEIINLQNEVIVRAVVEISLD